MTHEYPPKSIDQSELYRELVRPDGGYIAVTHEAWDADCEKPMGQRSLGPWDYLIMATLDGVEYWLPNDETWFHVIAVDHTNRLAKETGFCEMDDFTYDDSEYRFVMDPSDKQLKCKFEIGR